MTKNNLKVVKSDNKKNQEIKEKNKLLDRAFPDFEKKQQQFFSMFYLVLNER